MIRRTHRRFVNMLRRRAARHGPYGLILMYHRIGTPLTDPWEMAVSPQNFEAHLRVLSRYAEPVTAAELAERVTAGGPPNRFVAVTFDDGYQDNLTEALPLLQAQQVPATVYVTSGLIGQPEKLWWDLLTRVFLETPSLPQRLTLDLGNRKVSYSLGDEAGATRDELLRHVGWFPVHRPASGARQATMLALWSDLVALSEADRSNAVAALLAWAGPLDPELVGRGGRPMDAAELSRLAASPLIEIGGHTITHADLSQMSQEGAKGEIEGVKATLQEMTGSPVTGFAYPYGRRSEWSPAQVTAAGYSYAVATNFGLTTPELDPVTLPRQIVRDLDGAAFERLMRNLLGPPIR